MGPRPLSGRFTQLLGGAVQARGLIPLCALLLTTSAAAAPALSGALDVAVDAQLEVLSATTCLSQATPGRFAPMMRGARAFLLRARTVPEGRVLALEEGAFMLPAKVRCFAIEVAIGRLAREARDRDLGSKQGEALVLAPDVWLWLPRPQPEALSAAIAPAGGFTPPITGQGALELRVRFHLPPGVEVALPWPEKNGEFLVPPSAYDWQGAMVLGHFGRFARPIPGGVIEVITLGELRASEDALSRWATSAVSAVSTVLGRFPESRALVLVEPSFTLSGDPVVFGEALRGGGATVRALVSRSAAGQSFLGEWVLVHELSHFLFPFVEQDGAWLSEGLATYYQNVLRARQGLLSEREAIQRLEEGFQRGRDNAASDAVALEQASTEMHARAAYMRVYWTGAAVSLLADVELRAAGKGSLDEAVRAVQPLRRAARERVPTAEVLGGLDSASKTGVFARLARDCVGSKRFPDVAAAYRALGVAVKDGEVSLSSDPKAVALRAAIFGPR